MGAAESVGFSCEQCGRRFPWQPSMAGRRLRCACGAVMQCPVDPADAGAYEVAPTEPPRSASRRPSAIGSPPRETPVVPDGTGGMAGSLRPAAKTAEPAKAEPEQIRDFYMPLWLLGGGTVVELISGFLSSRHGAAGAVAGVVIELVAGTTLMLAGLLLAAWVRGIELGPMRATILKLAAISVAPAAVVALLNPIIGMLPFGVLPYAKFVPFGAAIGLVVEFVCYFALLGALFDLDQSDTWYCLCVIFLVHVGVYFLVLWGRAMMG